MSLNTIIKQIVENYIGNASLSDYVYATVLTKEGSIQIEKTGIKIPSTMVDVPAEYSDQKVLVSIEGIKQEIILYNALKVGERVVALKKYGGQRYTIIGRVK